MFVCAPVALAQLPQPVLVPEDMVFSGGVPKKGIPALTHLAMWRRQPLVICAAIRGLLASL